MENLYRFIGKHLPEIVALISAVVFLVAGLYLAFNFNPVWLNRAGALIIITGVLLAASRFHEWVAQKVIDSLEKSPEEFTRLALEVREKKTGVPVSDEERVVFLSSIKEQLIGFMISQQWSVKHNNSVYEPSRRRLKLWEIYLVVGGTFLNGFGDYIVALLKSK